MTAPGSELERKLDLYRGLVEVSALIASIEDFADLVSAVLDVACRVTRAEAASLFLVDPAGNARLAIGRSPEAGRETPEIVVPRGHGIVGWVLEHGEPLLVPDAYADPRFFREADRSSGFRTRSILCAPLERDGRRVGVIQVLNAVERAAFDAVDLEGFTAFARLVATAVDRLRLLEARREQERAERELGLAREIQQSFLPSSLPPASGIEFAVHYRPARNIGGDFYDLIRTEDDELYFAIGDVSGKGIPAALLMARALSALRAAVRSGLDPAEVVARWNAALWGGLVRGMFVTALVGRVRTLTREIQMSAAGHEPPLLLAAGGAGAPQVEAGPPAGIGPSGAWPSARFRMAARDHLVCYTDGLSESASKGGALLGRAGVVRLLERLSGSAVSAAAVVEALRQGEAAHRGAAEPRDDTTVLALGFS